MRRLHGGFARVPAVALLLAAPRAGAADFALARAGAPAAAIVIAANASSEEKLAAAELQDYVRKISGASLPISSSVRSTALIASVRIGVFGKEPVLDFAGEKPAADGFALETVGNVLSVVGGDARGALYGTYEMIEESLGVRWFMPGELGEDVPVQATIPLPRLKLRRGPAFPSVGGLTWGGSPGADAWELRMRGRIGLGQTIGHNWDNILPLTPANFALNPEWFAETGGVRGRSPQLCSAHPDVVRISADAARRAFDRDPGTPMFSISPNDGYGFCEDARCRAVDALYGVTDGSIADRLVHYANQVLADLDRTHPGRQVGIYAYVTHIAPPQRARPAPGYATQVAHMPWEFCHVHPLTDPACPANRRFLAYLQGWGAAVQHSGSYEYYGHFFVGAVWPIVHTIRKDIPTYHDLRIERFTTETQQHWATQGLNFYVAAKLLWDPSTDVDALLEEYYRRFYGKAAPSMRRYWERWEEAMIATAAEADGSYEWLRIFNSGLVQETGQYLAEAERLAVQDAPKIAQRVAFIKLGHAYTEAWTQVMEHGMQGDPAGAAAWTEEAIRRARLTKGIVPQAVSLFIVEDATRYLRALATSGSPVWTQLRPPEAGPPLPAR